MTDSLNIIALEAIETSRVGCPTLVELASDICQRHLDSWSLRLLREAGIRLDVTGRQHIKSGQRYVVMSNHQSHYDIAVLYRALQIPMQMIGTSEIARIPYWAMLQRMQIVPVTIDGMRGMFTSDQLRLRRENVARVTISPPIDPAAYGPERIDELVPLVRDAIEQHLSVPFNGLALQSKPFVEVLDSIFR